MILAWCQVACFGTVYPLLVESVHLLMQTPLRTNLCSRWAHIILDKG